MWLWLLSFIWLLGWCCIPHLLLLNKRPTSTLAWLWALLLFPVVGPALYLAIGSERVKRRRMERRQTFRGQERRTGSRSRAAAAWDRLVAEKAIDSTTQCLLHSLSTITRLPAATVSKLDILRQAPAFYQSLREAIHHARYDIQIETYIWRNDNVGNDFLNILIDAAHRGVTVRVLVDELGSFTLHEKYFQPLIEAGGQFSWCHTLSPLRNRYSFNLRNHRKLQIIDGAVAFVGGMNFGREYLGESSHGEWDDVQIRVEGSLVDVLQEIFAEDWFFATGRDDIGDSPEPGNKVADTMPVQVLRGGPDEEDQPMLRVNLALMAAARTRLWIATGYFIPGEIMQVALQVAAARGVDVRLLVSQRSEHPLLVQAGRSYYDALLRQGIRIFEYNKGIEHSKYFIIDEDWLSVGSTNLDERSLRLNFELSVLVRSQEKNGELARIFEDTTARSQEINRQAFSQRPYREKLLESALRPLSPVL